MQGDGTGNPPSEEMDKIRFSQYEEEIKELEAEADASDINASTSK